MFQLSPMSSELLMSPNLCYMRSFADIAESREKKQETQNVLIILITIMDKIMDTPSPLKAGRVSRAISESPSELVQLV